MLYYLNLDLHYTPSFYPGYLYILLLTEWSQYGKWRVLLLAVGPVSPSKYLLVIILSCNKANKMRTILLIIVFVFL